MGGSPGIDDSKKTSKKHGVMIRELFWYVCFNYLHIRNSSFEKIEELLVTNPFHLYTSRNMLFVLHLVGWTTVPDCAGPLLMCSSLVFLFSRHIPIPVVSFEPSLSTGMGLKSTKTIFIFTPTSECFSSKPSKLWVRLQDSRQSQVWSHEFTFHWFI